MQLIINVLQLGAQLPQDGQLGVEVDRLTGLQLNRIFYPAHRLLEFDLVSVRWQENLNTPRILLLNVLNHLFRSDALGLGVQVLVLQGLKNEVLLHLLRGSADLLVELGPAKVARLEALTALQHPDVGSTVFCGAAQVLCCLNVLEAGVQHEIVDLLVEFKVSKQRAILYSNDIVSSLKASRAGG